jgi:hypothetical protein
MRIFFFLLLLFPFTAHSQIMHQRVYSSINYENRFHLFTTGIIEDSEGFLIGGYHTNYNLGFDRGVIIRTDKFFNKKWAKTYDVNKQEWIIDITQTPDNNFIAIGNISNNIYLLKIKPNGDTLWTTELRSAGTNGLNRGLKVKTLPNGEILLLGFSYGNTQVGTIFKSNSSGNLIWSKSYSTSYFSDLLLVSDTSAVLTSESFIKVDVRSGEVIWAKNYILDNNILALKTINKSSDGGFILSGISRPIVVKVDNNGNVEWAKKIEVDRSPKINNIIKTSDNNFIITGQFYPENILHIFNMKLNEQGEILWTSAHKGSENVQDSHVIERTNGNLVVSNFTKEIGNHFSIEINELSPSGEMQCGEVTFEPTLEDITLTMDLGDGHSEIIFPTQHSTQTQIYNLNLHDSIVCTNDPTINIRKIEKAAGFSLYPNPTNGFINITNDEFKKLEILIFNSLGSIVVKQTSTEPIIKLDLSGYSTGLYFYQLSDGESTKSGKIIYSR